MFDSSIVFLDSGIGGLPYLAWVRDRRPHLPLAYVADTANFPYGESSESAVREAVSGTASRIFTAGTPRMLVVACNTASVAALDEIRSFAPCPVVGTVPAVKSAAGLPTDGPIGVLATRGTVRSPYLDRLIDSFANGRKIVRVAAGDIVRYVEEHWLAEGDDGSLPVMEPALSELRSSGVGSVVIGCTHFLHVMDAISSYLGEGVALVDSRDGVGRRILSLLDGGEHGESVRDAAEKGGPEGKGRFYVTKSMNGDGRYREFSVRFGLEWAGEIP